MRALCFQSLTARLGGLATPLPEHSAWNIKGCYSVIIEFLLGLPGLAGAPTRSLLGTADLARERWFCTLGGSLKAKDREAWGRGNHRWGPQGSGVDLISEWQWLADSPSCRSSFQAGCKSSVHGNHVPPALSNKLEGKD